VDTLKEYGVADPMGGRAWNKLKRGGPAGHQMTLSVGRRVSGDQASDGPVDSWVDDMDGDGDWEDWEDWQEIPVGEPGKSATSGAGGP
jgi:hypothetical protein